jgi:hypothetical protein
MKETVFHYIKNNCDVSSGSFVSCKDPTAEGGCFFWEECGDCTLCIYKEGPTCRCSSAVIDSVLRMQHHYEHVLAKISDKSFSCKCVIGINENEVKQ